MLDGWTAGRRKAAYAIGALATLGTFQGSVLAQQQEVHHFADTRIVVGEWTFVPIYTGDVAQSPDVVGFFTYADEFTRTGNNLSAVWYQYEQGEWSASSWYTVDLQEALKSVVLTLNIDNTLWEEVGMGPFEGTPESPKAFSNGVIATDPLASAVDNASDPVPLVDFLITLGYAAADVPIIGDQACNREEILNDIASMAGGYLVSGDDTTVSIPDDLCSMNPRPRGPRPIRPPKPATAPGWTVIPSAGPLPGAGWITGGWPTTGIPPVPDWYCFATAGGASCFCSREQRWGRWETTTGWFPRVRWHEVIERESCNSVGGGACPAGGPPPAGAGCSSTFIG